MTDDGDQPRGPAGGGERPRLRALPGVADASEPVPPVRLVREFKGLTVADMVRADLVARLPGQVRRALHHIEQGDLRAAEEALPGHFAPVLVGPGHRRARSRSRLARRLFAAMLILAVLLALTALLIAAPP